MCDPSEKAALRLASSGHERVRLVLAAVLGVAGALKGHQLATGAVSGGGVMESRWFLTGVVGAELCFALWLLAGRAQRVSWWIALACFCAFASVSASKGMAGEASCGCFGKVRLNPWHTFLLDVGAVALLLRFPPMGGRNAHGYGRLRLRGWLAVVAGVVVGVPGVVVIANYRTASISEDRESYSQRSLVVLSPEQWRSERFPLVEHIDVGQRLATGEWILVFYHLGCPRCEEVIEWFRRWTAGNGPPSAGPTVAFIEVPESGKSGAELALGSLPCVCGKLTGSHEWFVSTPAILAIKDGIVEEVCREQNLADFRRLLEKRCRVSRSET